MELGVTPMSNFWPSSSTRRSSLRTPMVVRRSTRISADESRGAFLARLVQTQIPPARRTTKSMILPAELVPAGGAGSSDSGLLGRTGKLDESDSAEAGAASLAGAASAAGGGGSAADESPPVRSVAPTARVMTKRRSNFITNARLPREPRQSR